MSDIKTIKCSNCGGDIKLDFDNLISYCPYCGAAIQVDLSIVKDVLVEKEKTKQILGRQQLQLEQERLKLEQEKLRLENAKKKKELEFKKELITPIFLVVMILIMIIYGVYIYPNVSP